MREAERNEGEAVKQMGDPHADVAGREDSSFREPDVENPGPGNEDGVFAGALIGNLNQRLSNDERDFEEHRPDDQ